MNTDADLEGRALAQTGAVTLDDNTITGAVCLGATEDEDEDEDKDIKITKKASPSSLLGPGSVTYTYKVTSEGNVSLKHVKVKDDKCSPVKFVSGDKDHDSKLDTDETWKYTCTKRVYKTETNKATAHASGTKDTDKATVTVSVPGFPNAGIDPDEKSTPWNIIIFSGILLVSASLVVVKRKRAI